MRKQPLTYIYIILGLIGVVSILFGSLQSATSTWRSMFLEIGIAALISAVLGLTVDSLASRQFQSEIDIALDKIKQSVFEETLHSMLPASVVSEVLGSIFNQSLIRQDFQVLMTLQYDDRLPTEKLRNSLCASYELRNFSGQTVRHVIKGFTSLIAVPPHDWVIYEMVHVEYEGGEVIELPGDSLQKITQQNEIVARFAIPIEVRPRESVRVRISRNIISHLHDSWTLSMGTLTEGLKITIRVPDDLSVSAEILHPAARSDSSSERQRIKSASGRGISTWAISGGILPFQGIVLMWQQKQAK